MKNHRKERNNFLKRLKNRSFQRTQPSKLRVRSVDDSADLVFSNSTLSNEAEENSIELFEENQNLLSPQVPLLESIEIKKELGVKIIKENDLLTIFNKFINEANNLSTEVKKLTNYNSRRILENRRSRITKILQEISTLRTKVLNSCKATLILSQKKFDQFSSTIFVSVIRELEEKEYVSKHTRKVLESLQEIFQAEVVWNVVEFDAYVRWLVGSIDTNQDVKALIAKNSTDEYLEFIKAEEELNETKEYIEKVKEIVNSLNLDSLKKEWRVESKRILAIIKSKKKINSEEVKDSVERKMNRILETLVAEAV